MLMRHCCEEHGCYYEKNVVKFDRWKDGFFPRKINFTDIDQFVEYSRHFLFIDWKHPQKKEPDKGQDMAYSRLSEVDKFYVAIVSGDPQAMTCEEIKRYVNGKPTDWEPCSIEQLDERIKRWVSMVDGLMNED